MTDVYMMVGIPASGKTTLAKRLIEIEKENQHNIPAYVSRDEIRRKITGSGKIQMEKEGKILEQFCIEILNKIKEGYTKIFADATHATPRSRYCFFHKMQLLAETLNVPTTQFTIFPFVVETPYEICFQRNSQRDAETAAPEIDMKTFYANCSYPSKTEIGFDKLFLTRYFYNPNTDSFQKITFKEDKII